MDKHNPGTSDEGARTRKTSRLTIQGRKMKLSGEDLGKLRTAVLEAMASEAELARLLSDRMNIRLKEVVPPGGLNDVVFDFLHWLEAHGRTGEFINVLVQERPHLTETLTPLRGIATAQLSHSEPLRTHAGWLRGWVVCHRWASASIGAVGLALIVGWIWMALPTTDKPDEPLPASHAPQIWNRAFVVPGQRIAYASPDTTYEVLEERLSKAERSILIAVYAFTSPQVKAWVLKAAERGVKVTIVHGFRGPTGDFSAEFKQKGVEIVEAGRSRGPLFFLYSPKIIIIDGKWVLVQTGNLVPTSVPPPSERSGNRDMGIAIESSELADYFTGLIEGDKKLIQDAAKSDLGADSDRRDPIYQAYEPVPRFPILRVGGAPGQGQRQQPDVHVRPIRILPVHSPDNYSRDVSELLASARESIDIAEPYVNPTKNTSNVLKLLTAIQNAYSRNPNLKVRLILSRRNDKSSVEKLLAFCEALGTNDVRLLNPRSGLNLSSKLLIVDQRVSLVASANWSESGVSRSRQVGVMIDSPDIAKYYGQIFDADWKAGLPADTPDE